MATRLFLQFSFYLLLLPLLLPPSLAQPDFTPTPYFFLHSVFLDSNALFIHGGVNSISSVSETSTQTFFLNLSVPWNVSSPVFQELPGRDTGQWGAASTLLNDRRTWILFDNQTTISQFDINVRNRRWVTMSTGEERQLKEGFVFPSFAAVTDPGTDQVFVIDGWNSTGLLRYFPANRTVDEVGPRAPVTEGYAAIWSTLRKAMLVHGGIVRTSTGRFFPRSLFQFYPTNHANKMRGPPPIYAPLTDTGDIPPPRAGHCMVEAKNGSKIVVFGGFDEDGVELGDIYVLDVATLEWTTGGRGRGNGDVTGMNVKTTTTVARGYAACGMSNNLFVAWGGARRDPRSPGSLVPVTENVTVVYNLTSQMWQTTFAFKAGDDEQVIPPSTTTYLIPTTTTIAAPDPSPSSPVSPAPMSMGAIVGGSVVGGLTLIAAAGAGFFFYRRRKLKPIQVQPAGALSALKQRWSDLSGHHQWWNNRRQSGGNGGGMDDPGHTFLRLESANGSSARSVFILREIPTPPPLAHGQQQEIVEVSGGEGGRVGSESMIEDESNKILPRARRDPQLVTIGRAFTYRDMPIDSSSTTTSTTLHS
jgi:hypothetical protein